MTFLESLLKLAAADTKTTPLSREEHKVVKQQLKELTKKKPKSERDLEALVGAKPTSGQLARHATIGAALGAGAHAIGTAIEGSRDPRLSTLKLMTNPRSLARAGVTGATFAALTPIVSQTADRFAAKKGKY